MSISAGLKTRSFHQALWTGSKMIVLGNKGNSNSNTNKTVESYNPSTNSWIANDYPLAPVNVGPVEDKIRNVAVWAGDKIITGVYKSNGNIYAKNYRPYGICDNPLALTQYVDELKTLYIYKKN